MWSVPLDTPINLTNKWFYEHILLSEFSWQYINHTLSNLFWLDIIRNFNKAISKHVKNLVEALIVDSLNLIKLAHEILTILFISGDIEIRFCI